MTRGPWIYAILLVASLAWAWRAWTDESAGPEEGEAVDIVAGKPDDLTKVVYNSEKHEVTITMLEDDLGRYGWARVVPAEGSKPTPELNPDDPPDRTEPVEFKVGGNAQKVLDGLAPFRAKRLLEGVEDHQLAELGLEPAEATLTLERGDKGVRTFDLSSKGFGGVNVYVRDQESGAIYIVDSKVLSPFQTAQRTLPDRSLHDVEAKAITAVEVSDGSRTLKFEQHNPDDRQAAFWAGEGETTANTSAGAWLDKALNLKALEYVQPGEEPADAAPAFSYTVIAADGHTVSVEVLRAMDAEGQEVFYARSPHTRSLVKLHRSLAAEAAADLDSALSGAEASPPEE